MQKEIGSNFDLDIESTRKNYKSILSIDTLGLNGSDSVFLSTGRSAQNMVLDTISERNPNIEKIALIPSFTCESVIEPFLQHDYKIFSYPVDTTLNINLYKFRQILSESKSQVVLFHKYFGFDTLKGFEGIIDEFSAKGVIFIEDRTQCIYSSFDSLSVDYTIGSLRKWAGLPDGGFAVCKTGIFNNKPTVYDVELESLKLEASSAKFEYLHKNIGDKQYYLDLFSRAENCLDSQASYFQISPSSIAVQSNLDISELKSKRRANYRQLYEELKNSTAIQIVTPELTEEDVPLYFVMTLKRREELQKHLRLSDVYAPVVWPKSKDCPEVCAEAQFVYDNSLCLPVDQRYNYQDMDRILKCIKEYVNSASI